MESEGKVEQGVKQRKKDKHLRVLNKLKVKGYVEKDQKLSDERNEPLLCTHFNKCCYCTKVFMNSKFLIKHILRRHSENLIALHQKLWDTTRSDNSMAILSQKSLINFMSSEFLKLRGELESVRQSFCNYGEASDRFSNVSVKLPNSNAGGRHSSESVEKIETISREMYDLKTTVFRIEAIVKNLEELCKGDDSAKKVNVGSALEESQVYKNIMDRLVELKSVMSEIHEENNAVCMKYLSDFQTELGRLEHLIILNSEKLNSSHHLLLQELEKKFEHEIQFFLSNSKARRVKTFPKKLTPTPDNQSDASLANERKKIRKTILNFDASEQDDIVNAGKKEIAFLLEKKLNVLNVPPGTNKLSSHDYDTKIRLIQSEKETLSKKYNSFSSIRHNLNSSANELVLQRLKEKKSKKLRFKLKASNSFPVEEKHSKNESSKLCINEKVVSSPKSIVSPVIQNLDDSLSVDERKLTPEEKFNYCVSETDFNAAQNSAASWKLINCSDISWRKLPSLPLSTVKELSPLAESLSSFESDEEVQIS